MRKKSLGDYSLKIFVEECKKFYLQNVDCEISVNDVKELIKTTLNVKLSDDSISKVNGEIREKNLLAPYVLCHTKRSIIVTRNIYVINMCLQSFHTRALGYLKSYSFIKKSIIENFGNNQEFNFQEYDEEIKNLLSEKEG